MPWTRLRLVREALAVGLDAQRRELTLRALTGWDLASLNRALEQGTVEIVPSDRVHACRGRRSVPNRVEPEPERAVRTPK